MHRSVARPTIQDVARRAGVSAQTVSNVLNDRPVTRKETRERVERAIRELGYERNSYARALRLRRSDTLGLLMEDEIRNALHDPVHAALLTGMVERARQRDYAVTVLVTSPETTEQRLDRVVRQHRVAGLLLSLQGIEGERRALARRLAELGMPTIVFEQRMGVPGVRTVASDNEGGGRQVAGHLLELGHRKIAWLVGAVRWPGAERRLAGLQEAMDAEGVEVLIWRCPAWSIDAARATARPLLSEHKPTAVCAANDLLAVGVIHAAGDLGLSIPGDLSVTGFDDFDFASFIRPSLTTVRIDAVEMGEWAADVLIALAEGADPAPSLMLATGLVVRESTGPVRELI